MKEHTLKSWPDYFQSMLTGQKTFDYRKNDRDFMVGDKLILREWDPTTKEYTGYRMRLLVTYVWGGIPGMPEGYVIMSIKLLDAWDTAGVA